MNKKQKAIDELCEYRKLVEEANKKFVVGQNAQFVYDKITKLEDSIWEIIGHYNKTFGDDWVENIHASDPNHQYHHIHESFNPCSRDNSGQSVEIWFGDIQEDLDSFANHLYGDEDSSIIVDTSTNKVVDNEKFRGRKRLDLLNKVDVHRWQEYHTKDILDRIAWIIIKVSEIEK